MTRENLNNQEQKLRLKTETARNTEIVTDKLWEATYKLGWKLKIPGGPFLSILHTSMNVTKFSWPRWQGKWKSIHFEKWAEHSVLHDRILLTGENTLLELCMT